MHCFRPPNMVTAKTTIQTMSSGYGSTRSMPGQSKGRSYRIFASFEAGFRMKSRKFNFGRTSPLYGSDSHDNCHSHDTNYKTVLN